ESHHCDGVFDCSCTQHTGWLVQSTCTGGKTVVTAFDNCDARGMEQPAMPSMKYSRCVEYQIDEKNMTVSKMWEYVKERGFDWYSAITSVTEYRPETKT
ncbi:aryl-sulfate sulfotransferase, partial [Salmonella enterica]|uniref:aryl-sulfate sulfotransferase n=1 Tax=Salmonella enterica TaxID=28901 RepID=UPI0020C2F65F